MNHNFCKTRKLRGVSSYSVWRALCGKASREVSFREHVCLSRFDRNIELSCRCHHKGPSTLCSNSQQTFYLGEKVGDAEGEDSEDKHPKDKAEGKAGCALLHFDGKAGGYTEGEDAEEDEPCSRRPPRFLDQALPQERLHVLQP